ncbi:MAG: ferritin family protein [Candidatus Omnitrophica bacterium]|nr:ferritin family protein [Candidatus Omnitrophota bacterium]
MKDLSELLGEALGMEEKGWAFYKEAAEKASNIITKKTFNFLADNEVFHIENIKNFYYDLKDKKQLPEVDFTNKQQARADDTSIFAKNLSELQDKIESVDDDRKACEFALDFEKNGYNFYGSMLKDTDDPSVIKLLEFLLSEEKSHYEILEGLHAYITDSHNWFMYEEGSFPQG